MTPFFSVVIPVYNRAAALARAIASVCAQSCQDFEILVVDDGSTDNPRAVIDRLEDPRIRFIAQANAGGGAARNTGIAQARGRFVALLDSDDVFLPHHLASMRTLLEATTATAGYARVRVDRGAGRVFLKPPRAVRADEEMAAYLLCDRGFVPTSTTVVPMAVARLEFTPDTPTFARIAVRPAKKADNMAQTNQFIDLKAVIYRFRSVTAPSDALASCAAYFASTPLV